ncbi:MAG: hypothetical protein K6F01_13315 [Selenomonas sp.]|uniref:hypothetical protein n=1 Tax=Selenomonas sp. TaxID=2053611 RepID=UPI0025FC4BEF|nr:hypothetical protein [Selenomonas sp.]MCR5440386.1 hypothetical protein [Selenomonas sp.]
MSRFKLNLRMTVTALLPLLFLPIMCFHYVPKVLHEVLGILWLVLVLIHIGQNRHWFASFMRGPWSILRIIGTVIDILLLMVLVGLVGAGSGISNHLFKEIMPLDIQRSILIHQLHVSSPYALLILMGLHWGLHFKGWWARWQLPWPACLPLKAVLALLVVGGGIYGSFLDRVGDRLLMKHIFATPATGEPAVIYVSLLWGIWGLYVLMGMLLAKLKG